MARYPAGAATRKARRRARRRRSGQVTVSRSGQATVWAAAAPARLPGRAERRDGGLRDGEKGGAPLIRALEAGPDGVREVEPASLAGPARLPEGRFLWVDLEAPAGDEWSVLTDVFRFHPLAVEDCWSFTELPKLDAYPEYLFIVLHQVEPREVRRVRREELNCFLGPGYLVTVHLERVQVVDAQWERERAGHGVLARGADALFHALASATVAQYVPVLEELQDRLEEMITRLLDDGPGPRLPRETMTIRRQLLRLRHALEPQREVFARLAERANPYVSERTRDYLRDVFDHCDRLVGLLNLNRELVTYALDLYLALGNNRTNAIVQRLTIVTTIFMPLTLIAGIYGMNFQHMPELRYPWAYPAVLLSMLALGAGLYAYFRRHGWLEPAPELFTRRRRDRAPESRRPPPRPGEASRHPGAAPPRAPRRGA